MNTMLLETQRAVNGNAVIDTQEATGVISTDIIYSEGLESTLVDILVSDNTPIITSISYVENGENTTLTVNIFSTINTIRKSDRLTATLKNNYYIQ